MVLGVEDATGHILIDLSFLKPPCSLAMKLQQLA